MIFIFSSSNDYSTTEVIKWLNYFGHSDVIRINYDDQDSRVYVKITRSEFQIQVNDTVFRLQDIMAIWYRKGEYWLCNKIDKIDFKDHESFSEHIVNLLQKEKLKYSEFIHFTLESTIPCLGFSTRNNPNKLIVLKVAKDVGFNIPHYMLTNSHEDANNFIKQHTTVISKPLSDVIYFFENQVSSQGYFSYTEVVDAKDLPYQEKTNIPSLFQNYIEKKFEVRSFYLDGQIFSMAILSQANPQTKTDLRKYDTKKPNRTVPFKLPPSIATKIDLLFKTLKLNTGSVDLVVTPDDNFYFLEVNPVGQFGMMSQSCNYRLEKSIALKLIEYAAKQ